MDNSTFLWRPLLEIRRDIQHLQNHITTLTDKLARYAEDSQDTAYLRLQSKREDLVTRLEAKKVTSGLLEVFFKKGEYEAAFAAGPWC